MAAGRLRIAGYASVFAVPDKGGDVVMPGAFAEATAPIPLLWQHKPHEPIGFVDSLGEDARGLRISARILRMRNQDRRMVDGVPFFFNDTATTEIYTRKIVGSVRCV